MNASSEDKTAGANAPAFFVQRQDEPVFALHLWPNRSMPRKNLRYVLGFTCAMFCIPMLPMLGTPVGLAILPFLIATVLLLWLFIARNYRDGATLSEELRLWPDLIAVERRDPDGQIRCWQANPYWVRTELSNTYTTENYLTLHGGNRDIELGAFLSPDERLSLRNDIDRALTQIRRDPKN